MFIFTANEVTCGCGSTDVSSAYTFDLSGDVDGKRFFCRACGNSDRI